LGSELGVGSSASKTPTLLLPRRLNEAPELQTPDPEPNSERLTPNSEPISI